MSFDIVIPVGIKDVSILEKQIEYTKRNIIGYRNIYIISNFVSKPITGCEIIPENRFIEFNHEIIEKYIGKGNTRSGWYLQQLIKLYAFQYVPNILDKYLVIDCDTFFMKPTRFMDDNGKTLLNVGDEYHPPYFNHMQKMHPSLVKYNPHYSGISHHMLFEKQHLLQLFELVEKYHHSNSPFWEIFLKCIEPVDYIHSGASEYELYFNYLMIYHPDSVCVRPLKWKNETQRAEKEDYDYISYHWYMQK